MPLDDFLATLTQDQRDYIAEFNKRLAEIEENTGHKVNLLWAILFNGEIIPADPLTCSMWMSIPPHGWHKSDTIGDKEVCTSFSVVPFSWINKDRDPCHFETMIFGNDGSTEVTGRYQTEKEAVDGHAQAVSNLSKE